MTSNEDMVKFINAEIDGFTVQRKIDTLWCARGNSWDSKRTYRIKPEPRVRWINYYKDSEPYSIAYKTESAAKASADAGVDTNQVKFIEDIK